MGFIIFTEFFVISNFRIKKAKFTGAFSEVSYNTRDIMKATTKCVPNYKKITISIKTLNTNHTNKRTTRKYLQKNIDHPRSPYCTSLNNCKKTNNLICFFFVYLIYGPTALMMIGAESDDICSKGNR